MCENGPQKKGDGPEGGVSLSTHDHDDEDPQHHNKVGITELIAKLKRLAHQHRTLTQCVAVVTASLLTLAAFLSSYFHIIIVLWVCGLGTLFCILTIRPDELLPNVLISYTRSKKVTTKVEAELTVLKTRCPVCGKENCSRHRPELNIVALQPWTNLRLPQTVNAALEEFLTICLKEFVYTWYRDLSEDEAFVDELRSSLRFIVSVLLRRLQKVDIPSLVLQKVLKIAMRHLHFYLEVKRKEGNSSQDLQDAVLEAYNGSLHIAVRNRRCELDYIKSFVERAFPYILPIQSHKCKSLCVFLREILAGAILLPSMDVIADPDIINNLLLIFFEKSKPAETHPPVPEVNILQNFSQPLCKNDSCLHKELDDILDSTDSLFHFMQFLKTEASVNVLQFYLAVDEFNNQLLTPELSRSMLSSLHDELCNMYHVYCDPAAVDRIDFEDEIVNQLREICEGPVEGVIRLQTTTPLFRAHERMYELLNVTFLPLFHQSDDYYKMLCGERLPTRMVPKSTSSTTLSAKPNTTTTPTSTPARSVQRQNPMSINKLGNRLKTVFKTNTIDGGIPDDVDFASEEGDFGNGELRPDEDLLPRRPRLYHRHDDRPLKDLSAWRVSLTEVLTKFDIDNPKREMNVFVVEVRRVDVIEDDFEPSMWTVERRYQEFYVLEQKLTEFHGEFTEIRLPPKKAFGTKKKDFLESLRPAFEQYLQNLLSLHILKGSELLYTFLTPYNDFSSSIFPDINLGRIMKSGALKLVKERGQHLDPFLQSLLVSVDSANPKPSRFSDKDSDTASISSEKMANSIFENNANTNLSSLMMSSPTHTHSKSLAVEVPIEGVGDAIMYLADRLYRSPRWLVQLLLSVRILARNTVDCFLDWYLGRRMDNVLQQQKVVQLIHLLRDALFFDNDLPRTEEEKRERKRETFKELKEFIPKVFAQAIGTEKFEIGTSDLLEALQQPKLNKQLSYVLLDVCIEELFPEMSMTEDPRANIRQRMYRMPKSPSS